MIQVGRCFYEYFTTRREAGVRKEKVFLGVLYNPEGGRGEGGEGVYEDRTTRRGGIKKKKKISGEGLMGYIIVLI